MSYIKLSSETEQSIVDLYLRDKNMSEVGRYFRTTRSVVKRILKSKGISTLPFNVRAISDDKKDEVWQAYQSGVTQKEIGKLYGVNQTSIRRYFDRWELKAKPPTEYLKGAPVNHDYFSKINTHEKAQILGFIYADGCIIDGKQRRNLSNYLSIALHIQDIDYLNEIRVRLKHESPLKIQKNPNHCKLQVGSLKMTADLIAVGAVPRKSLILKFPSPEQVPEEFWSSFICGYFEGDGWACCNRVRDKTHYNVSIGMLGTLDFLTGVSNSLSKVGVVCRIVKAGNVYRWTVNNRPMIDKFFKYIYANVPFKMQRKNDKYLDIIKTWKQK